MRHQGDLHASVERADSFEGNVIKVFEYMRRVCPNEDEARWKMVRFVLILQYIAEHIQEFDKGDYAVNGSSAVGALVGQHLFRAVHEIFTTNDLDSLGHGPSPECVLELAAKYKPSENDGTAEA
jgi:hypothetical protein